MSKLTFRSRTEKMNYLGAEFNKGIATQHNVIYGTPAPGPADALIMLPTLEEMAAWLKIAQGDDDMLFDQYGNASDAAQKIKLILHDNRNKAAQLDEANKQISYHNLRAQAAELSFARERQITINLLHDIQELKRNVRDAFNSPSMDTTLKTLRASTDGLIELIPQLSAEESAELLDNARQGRQAFDDIVKAVMTLHEAEVFDFDNNRSLRYDDNPLTGEERADYLAPLIMAVAAGVGALATLLFTGNANSGARVVAGATNATDELIETVSEQLQQGSK
jgi:hypothetical protein